MCIPFLLLSAWCIYKLCPPQGHLIEIRLCMVLLEAPQTAQSHVTFPALQLPFNLINFQTMFHCHCTIKWNYDIRFHYELTENWMRSVPQLRCKCLVAIIERAIYSCSCNGRAWHWCTKQGIFSPVSQKLTYFHLSIPLVDRVEYLRSVANILNLQLGFNPCWARDFF
jgi:hypothetical protein